MSTDIETEIRRVIRLENKADATADAYVFWTLRFLSYCRQQGIGKETQAEKAVERFLSSLANDDDSAASTQNQAFYALCYFFGTVRKRPLVGVSALRAKRPKTIPDVADQSEIARLFAELEGVTLLCARLMYGCNFRIGELGKLRIKDFSFERKQIHIHNAKGDKSRLVQFPEVLHAAVRRQIESMRVLWSYDVAEGLNGVSLPNRWGIKSPKSHLDFAWWYFLTADNYSKDRNGKLLRHHRDMGNIGRQINQAAHRAGIDKRITAHTLRHSYCTHSLENGIPIHVAQQLMGHTSVETTQLYSHISKDGATAAKSPIESLLRDPELAKVNREPVSDKTVKLRLFTG